MHPSIVKLDQGVDAPFVKVYNEGTKEYSEMGFEKDMFKMDLHRLALLLVGRDPTATRDSKRNNLQINLGWSCGLNLEKDNDPSNCGASMNKINKGTEEHVHLFVTLSGILKKLGVPWADDKFSCEFHAERNKLYAKSLHPSNSLEGVTIALLELFPNQGSVKKHVDDYNDLTLSEVLVCNGVVRIRDKLYRVSVIAYMRKACADSVPRRRACIETTNMVIRCFKETSPLRLPFSNPTFYPKYARSIGELGMGVMAVLKDNRVVRILSAALLTRPH
ncbi:MAG: hypothetical protein AAF587_45040, partial [Bacteroidota bacterium]